MEIISKYKLLCRSEDYNVYSDGSKIYVQKGGSKEYGFIGCLPIDRKYQVIQDIRMVQRLFRLEPRCGVFTKHNEVIVSMHGNVYRIDLDSGLIEKEHIFRGGMNNPLSFCIVAKLPGFQDGIFYGEYFGNQNQDEVHIFRRDVKGNWEKVFSFERGEVKHIHKIFVHPQRNSVFVLTGDSDHESAIWEFKDNFRRSKKIASGKQCYRSCVAFPCPDGIVYATDTPLENNAIYQMKIREDNTEILRVCSIDGPCIYGTIVRENNMVFATSVEPDSRLTGVHYMITNRLGKGVKNHYSHIYCGNLDKGFERIFSAKKDFLPMLLFGFGTFQFPNGVYDCIVATGQSIKNYDGKTIRI